MVECNCDKMQSKILSLLIVEKCETKKIIVKQQCSEFAMSSCLVQHSKFVVPHDEYKTSKVSNTQKGLALH